MYYHTVVLHLFRPFLKVDLVDSNVHPRDICTTSAEGISSLMNTYRDLYGLRRSTPMTTHFVMTASTIHLLDLPSLSASASLAQGIADLRAISTNHLFARRCLLVIKTLGEKWAIELPKEVEEASRAARDETLSPSPASWHSTLSMTSESTPTPRRPSLTDMGLPFADLERSPFPPVSKLLYWSPFPDQVMPMLPPEPENNDPMDVTSMLNLDDNNWIQYGHDGFIVDKGNDSILPPKEKVVGGVKGGVGLVGGGALDARGDDDMWGV